MKLGAPALIASHLTALAIGFALGVYFLPILIAPPAPRAAEVDAAARDARFKGTFRRSLKGSDVFHWGEGTIYVGGKTIALRGKTSPGPAYKLYLSPEFVETKADFERIRTRMVRVGDIDTFENFVVAVPASIDPAQYTTAIVWCEAFSQFITAARYR